jgi:hypothetical protein
LNAVSCSGEETSQTCVGPEVMIRRQWGEARSAASGRSWSLFGSAPGEFGCFIPPVGRVPPGEPGMANVIDLDRVRRRDLLGGLIREYRLAA